MSIGEVILVFVGAVLLISILAKEWVRYERRLSDAKCSKKGSKKHRK